MLIPAGGMVMEKYAYIVFGFVLSIITTGAVGLATGVSGVCVYVNSCEPDQEIQRLQSEITGLNKRVNEKNDEVIQSTNKIIELQDKAKMSLEGAQEIIVEIKRDMKPTTNTIDLIEQYVKRQKEIERHVTKILCVHQPDLVAPGVCSGG